MSCWWKLLVYSSVSLFSLKYTVELDFNPNDLVELHYECCHEFMNALSCGDLQIGVLGWVS